MNTVLESDKAIVLFNISWPTYTQVADAVQKEARTHFTYDRGRLEIMVVSIKHEVLKKLIATLFERLAQNLEIDYLPAGSTTFRREDLARGFEPDECYYIENVYGMRGKDEVNLDFDPPPDLTIEIDIASSSIDRMGIFAAVGVPEVWRHDGRRLTFNIFRNGEYVVSKTSAALPGVDSLELTNIIEEGKALPTRDFLERIDVYTQNL